MEKNSELRSKGYWGTASFKRMMWEGVSEKVTFEQRREGSEGELWGSQEEECPRQKEQQRQRL